MPALHSPNAPALNQDQPYRTSAAADYPPNACIHCPHYTGYRKQGKCSILHSLLSPCFVDTLRRKHERPGYELPPLSPELQLILQLNGGK